MTLPEYLTALAKLHANGRATEHSYRGDLQQLLSSLCPGITVTNEPQRIACGAPDYILTRKDIRDYRRMIVALMETGKMMEEEIKVEEEKN